MTPQKYVIRAITADSYELIIDYVDEDNLPIDLAGETITLKIFSGDTQVLELTDGSGLTITPASGRIVVDLTGAQTDTLDGRSDRRYTLRLDTSEKTILYGTVEVQNV